MHKKIYYYVTGNTAEGFVNLLPSNVNQLKQIITLSHPSNPLKTALIKKIIAHYEADYDLEIIYSSFGNEFLDGVIIRGKSLAFLTDTVLSDDIETHLIDLESSVPLMAMEDPCKYKKKMQKHTNASYENFATGLKLHDNLEAIYINEMDFRKADLMAERFIVDLLYKVEPKERKVTIVNRLFGTNTPEGAVNVVPRLLADLSTCYFVKGRAGTGKSTFMRKVAKACKDHGFDVELYHCSFDPNSIDMVLVRDLNFCVFDSTEPHEFFPERKGHAVIDMYEETVTPGTDEKYEREITKVTNQYQSYMKKGIKDLQKARSIQAKWEQQYPFTTGDVNELFKSLVSKY